MTKVKTLKPIRFYGKRYPIGSILELDEAGLKVFENKPGLVEKIKPEPKAEVKAEPKAETKPISEPESKPEGKNNSKGKE